jgi:hypothetical protein
MKMNKRKISVLVTIMMLSACFQVAQAQLQIKAQKIGSRIDVYIGSRFFTRYIFAGDEKYPFFFPVNGPSGAGVTSMRNGTYPHHSSLFFGCDRVNGGNYWQEGLERGQIVSLEPEIVESGADRVVITDQCIWKRPGAPAPVKDVRTIVITAPSEELYQIDFAIEMEMLTDVVIEKTNHSLFSARIDPDLATVNGGTMINAEGQAGEKATFGKPSPWMDCYGTRNGKPEGIAILQHPSNEWYPSKWFTRDYGFISPTPMWWPENGENTRLKKGQVVRLRYRTLIHSGTSESVNIREQFDKFSNE